MGNKDTNSLAHTTWECKYHIVLTLSTIINTFQQKILPYHDADALWYGNLVLFFFKEHPLIERIKKNPAEMYI